MAYSSKVIDHYENPRNVGSLAKDDPNVGTGLVGAPECGDVMKLQILVNPETGLIEDARFKTFGCGSAIASSSLATEWLKGKTIEEAMAIRNTAIVEELSADPVSWLTEQLADPAAVLARAGVGADEYTQADETGLAAAAPEIVAAVKRMLDGVRDGELAPAPAEPVAAARTGWL